jgi:hypothetical protein
MNNKREDDMKHDPSTEGIKARLAAPRSPKVVTHHGGVNSVGHDAGKPADCSGDCSGPNADANAAYNDHMARATKPAGKLSAGQLVGSGEKLS